MFKGGYSCVVYDFAISGKWPRGSNASFISMIPKSDNPQQLCYFRPTLLVGCLFKIISKILSNRLKKVMIKIIDFRQSAFLEGRGLMDDVSMANEEDVKRKKKSCVFFKVDYEKAYDLVRWDFIYYMIGMLGFYEKWIFWIKIMFGICFGVCFSK